MSIKPRLTEPNIQNMTVNQRESHADVLVNAWKEDFDKPIEWNNHPDKIPLPAMPNPALMQRLVKNEGPINNDDFNQLLSTFYLMRVQWMQAVIDPRRDFEGECGYPYAIIPKQYRYMFDREGIAARVVGIYPDECWAVDPLIYENEELEHTSFEEAWQDLLLTAENNPLHYMHRVDVLSGIGRYGVLLLGTDDGLDLSEPLPVMDEQGNPTGKKANFKILYMRPFDELLAHVINYERDPMNPRFGRPVYYHLIFADIRVGEPGMTAAAVSVTSRIVHWSRVIHVCDNRESSEVFGVPRMQQVFNRLCDVRKILGGSAEMFWKGGFPGYSFELNPDLVTAGVTFDKDSVKKEFEAYSNGLQRYLAIVGLQAKSLAPQVANPMGNLEAQLQSIAMTIGAPLRIFMGSEQAQLASGQDVRTWNRRLMKRQGRYLTPMLIRPFVDRLIMLGVLPAPDGGRYKVFWPDINIPSDDEKSQMADRQASTLMKYIMGGGYQVVPPTPFLQFNMGYTGDQIEAIKNAQKTDAEWIKKIVPPQKTNSPPQEGGSGNPGGG